MNGLTKVVHLSMTGRSGRKNTINLWMLKLNPIHNLYCIFQNGEILCVSEEAKFENPVQTDPFTATLSIWHLVFFALAAGKGAGIAFWGHPMESLDSITWKSGLVDWVTQTGDALALVKAAIKSSLSPLVTSDGYRFEKIFNSSQTRLS